MNTDPLPKNNTNDFFDFVIVGGGLAGLICSIVLSQHGFKTILLEKKKYPFHKVCGEYVSNEVIGYLNSIGFNPVTHNASQINRLRISNHFGKNIYVDLDMGGFGLSRFTLDHSLSLIAKKSGASVIDDCRVNDITYADDSFTVSTAAGMFNSRFVIGSYGKRDMLDKKLNRNFIQKRTRYMGVKYHVKIAYPINEIGLDNFPGGYCGIVKIEDDKYNLCYLYRRNEKYNFKNIRELEERKLFTNPFLKNIFKKSEFLTSEPEVINEIYFENKTCIENHVLLCGDSAGLITPLCGNGMAMAIHGAKILSEILISNFSPGANLSLNSRIEIEKEYEYKWKNAFSSRLFWGRNLQRMTGNALVTASTLKVIHSNPSFEKWIINKTHGKSI